MRLASLSMHLMSPSRTFRVLKLLARATERLTPELAARLEREVGGGCLPRSMAIASRLVGAVVAIGVARPGENWSAHAWVELNGQPLNEIDNNQPKIAEL